MFLSRCGSSALVVDGVRKELLVFALVDNLVRVVMHETATHAGVELDRVSFVDAWR